jgi:hypothetical protein
MTKSKVVQEFLLLSPKGEGNLKETKMASRPSTLKGKTIAVINAFRNPQGSSGDLLSNYMKDLLLREGVSEVLPLRKKSSPTDMADDIIEYLNSKAQGVIILEGD